MRTIDYLFDPIYRELYLPGVMAALLIAVLAAPLSVLVVLKRLSFMGQGVSHAAFGGVGLALLLGFGATISDVGGSLAMDGVVLVFALAAAGVMAWMTERGRAQADTAIGIVLAVCMAAGFVMHGLAGEVAATAGQPAPPSLEAVLFGAVLRVGPVDVVAAAVATGLVVATLAVLRRPLLFWAFDEVVCVAHGVRAGLMRGVLLVLLSVAVVVTMKLAGIVLATAMLVLPGAAALRLSDRMVPVLLWSLGLSLGGVAAGLVMAFELDWPTGPSIVGVLTAAYLFASLIGGTRRTVATA